MTYWVRLWCDMPTDPKWRVIAKKSGRPISEVITVFVAMMTNAGNVGTSNTNASERGERGELSNWSDEDIAAGFDMEADHVKAIRDAMQGKTLNGAKLLGWEKRQPKREDNSAERAKQWRERKRTHPNAAERPDSDSDSEKNNPPLAPPGGGAAEVLPFFSQKKRRRDRMTVAEYIANRDAGEVKHEA